MIFSNYLNILIYVMSQNSHCWSNLICQRIYSTEGLCEFLHVQVEELLWDREERERERRPTKNLNKQVADIKKRLCGDVSSSILIITRFKFDHHRELFNGRLYLWSLLHLSSPLHFKLYLFFLSLFNLL